MKQVRFTSKKVVHNYVEETEEGELVEHAKFTLEKTDLVADVLEERKHTYKLKLPDGNIIIKKKNQVIPINS